MENKDIFEQLDEELDRALEAKDFNLAGNTMTKMWLQFQIMLVLKNSPELKELTFLKIPIDIGYGKYLLTFMHVDGKKIQLHREEDVK